MFQLIYAKGKNDQSIELARSKWANAGEKNLSLCICVCLHAYSAMRTSERMSKYKSKQQIARERIVIIIDDNRELAMTATTLDLSYVYNRTHTHSHKYENEKKTRHNSIIILCVRSYESRYLIFFSVSRFLESHLHTNLSFASCGVVCFMIDSLTSFCSKTSYKFFCSRCFQKKKLEVFCILFAFLSLCPSLKARQRNDNSEKISYLLYCLEHVVCASTQADLIDFNQLWFFQIAQIESGTNSKWTVSSHNYRFKKVK